MKWSKCKITVYQFGGNREPEPVEVDAICKGLFAIHQNLGNPKDMTLTHIPSGMALIYEASKHQLYRAANQLNQLDWTGIEVGQQPPETFDREQFRKIQRHYSW